MPVMVEIQPDHPCDRCDHPSKYHAVAAQGSECRVVGAKFWRGETVPRGMRAKKCPCDGYWPA